MRPKLEPHQPLPAERACRAALDTIAGAQEYAARPEEERGITGLIDSSGQPIGGQLITFFGSLGEVSPASALSDVTGRITGTFTGGSIPGQARVSVLAGYASASSVLEVEQATIPGENLAYLPVVLR